MRSILFLPTFVLWLCVSELVYAAPSITCLPYVALPANSQIQLDQSSQDRIRAIGILASPLILKQSAFSLGVPNTPGDRKLEKALTLAKDTLRIELLKERKLSLEIEADQDLPLQGQMSGRIVKIPLLKGQTVDWHQSPLALNLAVTSEVGMSVPIGTSVSVDAEGHLTLLPGATLVWEHLTPESMTLTLSRSTDLEEVPSNGSKSWLPIGGLWRGLPGQVIQLNLEPKDLQPDVVRVMACTADGQNLHASVQACTGDGCSAQPWRLSLQLPTTQASGHEFSQIGREIPLRIMMRDGDKLLTSEVANVVVTPTWAPFVVAAIGLILIFLLAASMMKTRRVLTELLLHSSGRNSLSNFQVLGWTLLTLFAFFYAWVANGSLLNLSPSVLGLLAMSGGTSVLSRIADFATGSDKPNPKAKPSLSDLFRSENGGFDLLRFQMFGFTIFAWIYSFYILLVTAALPELSSNLFLLMGVSNGAYLGMKAQGVLMVGEIPVNNTAGDSVMKRLQAALDVSVTGIKDATTSAAIKGYKVKNNIYPTDDSVDARLLQKLGVDDGNGA